MEVVLRKYGNSTVAVLPPAVLKDLGLSAGQAMTLDTNATKARSCWPASASTCYRT